MVCPKRSGGSCGFALLSAVEELCRDVLAVRVHDEDALEITSIISVLVPPYARECADVSRATIHRVEYRRRMKEKGKYLFFPATTLFLHTTKYTRTITGVAASLKHPQKMTRHKSTSTRAHQTHVSSEHIQHSSAWPPYTAHLHRKKLYPAGCANPSLAFRLRRTRARVST